MIKSVNSHPSSNGLNALDFSENLDFSEDITVRSIIDSHKRRLANNSINRSNRYSINELSPDVLLEPTN